MGAATPFLPFLASPPAAPMPNSSHSPRRALSRAVPLTLCAALSVGALPATAHAQADKAKATQVPLTPRGLGVDTTAFDRATRPQDDFFRFVNGGWLKRTPIPDDASSTGSFRQLGELSTTRVRAIAEGAMKSNAPAGSKLRKVGDMYASASDTARLDALGTTPIQGELDAIAAVRTTGELPALFAKLARLNITRPLAIGVGTDQKNSQTQIVTVSQSGLGLGTRDNYLRNDAKSQAVRAGYQAYLTKIFELTHTPDAAGAAARVLALETAIATRHWDAARNRDRNATYNRLTVAELQALAPRSGWQTYLAAAGLGAAQDVVVRQPDYVRALDTLIAETPVGTWKEYSIAKVADEYAGALSTPFRTARFEFRGKTLAGQQAEQAIWKRAVAATNGVMGEAVGEEYVKRHFKPEAKARMDAMVRNLIEAYRIGIDSLEWMSPTTKAQAKDKLAKFTVKIAYPDQWRDYSALDIKRDELVGNLKRSASWQYDEQMARLGKAPDKQRWGMTPQTVNAYYNAGNNEIVFPAAILQPPFFDMDADDAVNYGGIGAVIGHEIGHGFDDQGRKSDGDGNLRDWWTPEDAKAFEARAAKLGAQYAALSPIPGMNVNGALTMGENIGDVSGLAQAWRAYQLSLNGKPAPVINGFTGAQRFFLGFAQIWRSNQREEALRSQLLSDPHSPGMYRAFVPLVNNDEFMRAFNVKPGDKMWRAPEDRVKIW
jgi:predicted metalloendopeptidase